MKPKPVTLEWKKRTDGSLTAKYNKDVYTLRFLPTRHAPKMIKVWYLARNEQRVYERQVVLEVQGLFMPDLTEEEIQKNDTSIKAGKEECKEIAGLLANGAKPVYASVMKSLKKDKRMQDNLMMWIKDSLRLDRIPKVEGKHDKAFHKGAEDGIKPTMMLKAKVLPKSYIDSLMVELFPIWFPPYVKQVKQLDKEWKKSKIATQPEQKTPVKKEIEPEVYNGPKPEERTTDKIRRIAQPTIEHPCPFKPENAKFSTLLAWAEKVRDYYEVRGLHATIEYLTHAVRNSFASSERSDKAVERLHAIYSEEWNRFVFRLKLSCEQALKPPEKKETPTSVPAKREKPGKDKWGFRLGTRAAAVNAALTAIPMTRQKIERLAKSEGSSIASHLSTLVKRKKIIRFKSGKYANRKMYRAAKKSKGI